MADVPCECVQRTPARSHCYVPGTGRTGWRYGTGLAGPSFLGGLATGERGLSVTDVEDTVAHDATGLGWRGGPRQRGGATLRPVRAVAEAPEPCPAAQFGGGVPFHKGRPTRPQLEFPRRLPEGEAPLLSAQRGLPILQLVQLLRALAQGRYRVDPAHSQILHGLSPESHRPSWDVP